MPAGVWLPEPLIRCLTNSSGSTHFAWVFGPNTSRECSLHATLLHLTNIFARWCPISGLLILMSMSTQFLHFSTKQDRLSWSHILIPAVWVGQLQSKILM